MSTRKTKKQSSKSGENSSSEAKFMNESEFKFAFALVDTNKDGLINQEELKNILNLLGIKANDQLIEQMLIDIVKTGKLFFLPIYAI
jgi:EF hand